MGTWNSPESLQTYARLIAESASGRIISVGPSEVIIITELCRSYYEWAAHYYQNILPYKATINTLVTLYGDLLVDQFSPLK